LVRSAWQQQAERRQRRFLTRASLQELAPLEMDVVFATVTQLLHYAPACHALYVACPITKEQLYLITAWVHRGGLVVVYQ
jgi:hypothetical protein